MKSVTDPFLLPDEIIHKITAVFNEEMELGLEVNPKRQSSLAMANTFIPKHLTGDGKSCCNICMIIMQNLNFLTTRGFFFIFRLDKNDFKPIVPGNK